MSRMTMEQMDKLIADINKRFADSFKYVIEVSDGYVELPCGTRAVIKTRHISSLDISGIKQFKNFISDEIERLQDFDTLYLRCPWGLRLTEPSFLDPCTFDYVYPPVPGRFNFVARYRAYNSETGEFNLDKHSTFNDRILANANILGK